MATIILIILTVVAYFAGLNHIFFGLNILFLEHAFFWQPLSEIFMHASLTHLILNMLMLFQFGRLLEADLGPLRFVLLYLIGGIFCSLFSFIYVYLAFYYFDETVNLIGASGAICVLMGYFAGLHKDASKGLLVALLLLSFAPLLMGIKIAWYAHLAGFFCGLFAAKIKIKKIKK